MGQITTDKLFLKECDQFSFNIQDETALQYVKPFKCKNDKPCFEEANQSFNEMKNKYPYTRKGYVFSVYSWKRRYMIPFTLGCQISVSSPLPPLVNFSLFFVI